MASDPSGWQLRSHVATALIGALVVLLASVLVFPGDRSVTAQPVSDTLVFAGCDSNVPLTRLLARTFMQRHPDVRIQLRTVGSTNGVALAAAAPSRSAWSPVPFAAGRNASGSPSSRTRQPR